MADEDGEVVVTPLFQDVVEVVVVATLVVGDLYDVVRDDMLKNPVRADVDQVVVVDVLSMMALSDADLDVSHLVDVVVVIVHLYIVVVKLYVVELYLSIVGSLVVLVGTLYLVDKLNLFVVDH